MTITARTAPARAPGEHICPCRLPAPARIRALRKEAKVSLSEAADRVGVDVMTLSRWERGLHRPRLRYLSALLDLVDWLEARITQHTNSQAQK